MEFIVGILVGAAVMACGILIGKKMHGTPEQKHEQEPVDTEADRRQREKDRDLREQWETMLRYDGRSA